MNVPILHMMVGLPASGKSRFAKEMTDCFGGVIYSSDKIREELSGNINNQDINNEVFNILHKRVKENLQKGINIFYDATNINYKRRMSFLKELKNINLAVFPRLTWLEAMERYGSDKPDTRFEMELKDLTKLLKGTKMNVFSNVIENDGQVKCLIIKNNGDKYSRSDVEHLTDFVKIYGAKGLAWLKYDNDTFNGVIAKNIEEEKLQLIKETYNIENNDLILVVADVKEIVWAALGALRIKIGRELNLIDQNKYNFLWVVDFPMFEYSATDKRYKSVHHPFTMPKQVADIKNPASCLAQAYDIVLNGYELGGGSVRIHDPKVQQVVFEALGLTKTEIKNKFGFFIDAYNYGAPSHAGLAIGLERLTMLLCQTENIKDVVAFPKTQSASDLMSEAPSAVSSEQLTELGIKLKEIANEK